jgi:hypothetical protein
VHVTLLVEGVILNSARVAIISCPCYKRIRGQNRGAISLCFLGTTNKRTGNVSEVEHVRLLAAASTNCGDCPRVHHSDSSCLAEGYTSTHTTRIWCSFRADSYIPCRSPAATLPFPDSAERGQVAHMPSLDGRCQFTHNTPFPCRPPAATLPWP